MGGGGHIDIEFLKQALQDNRLWMSMATVKSVSIAKDRSFVRATVDLLPTLYEARVFVAAEYVAPGVGLYFPLRAGDMVLVAFPEADSDSGILIKRLSSQEDSVPVEFENDKVVLKMTADEEFVVVGNTQKFGSKDSDENLVLGQVLKTSMSKVLAALAVHQHISSPPGFLSFIPSNAAVYTGEKASPVDDEAMLSDKTFTEK